MVPTFFTNLALGTITNMVASILALAAWVPGSGILQGNLFFDTTNNATPGIYVNANQVLALKAGGLNFATNGTQSGVTLFDNNVVGLGTYSVTCTGTGGNVKVGGGAKYDTCIIPPLLTTTGAIKRIDLMVSASPTGAIGIDCGFVKGRVAGTGTSFTGISNFQTSSGSIATVYGSGAVGARWNSADFIKCGTLTNPTTGFAAKLRVEYFDDTSE